MERNIVATQQMMKAFKDSDKGVFITGNLLNRSMNKVKLNGNNGKMYLYTQIIPINKIEKNETGDIISKTFTGRYKGVKHYSNSVVTK